MRREPEAEPKSTALSSRLPPDHKQKRYRRELCGRREDNSGNQRPPVKDTNRAAPGEPKNSKHGVENAVRRAALRRRHHVGDSRAKRSLLSAHAGAPQRHSDERYIQRTEENQRCRSGGKQNSHDQRACTDTVEKLAEQ